MGVTPEHRVRSKHWTLRGLPLIDVCDPNRCISHHMPVFLLKSVCFSSQGCVPLTGICVLHTCVLPLIGECFPHRSMFLLTGVCVPLIGLCIPHRCVFSLIGLCFSSRVWICVPHRFVSSHRCVLLTGVFLLTDVCTHTQHVDNHTI